MLGELEQVEKRARVHLAQDVVARHDLDAKRDLIVIEIEEPPPRHVCGCSGVKIVDLRELDVLAREFDETAIGETRPQLALVEVEALCDIGGDVGIALENEKRTEIARPRPHLQHGRAPIPENVAQVAQCVDGAQQGAARHQGLGQVLAAERKACLAHALS